MVFVTSDDLLKRALGFRWTKQPAEAIPLFRQYLDTESSANPGTASAYEHALFCHAVMKQWSETEALGREAIGRHPQLAIAYQYLGEALWRQNRDDEARSTLERAVELGPMLSDARALLAIALRGRVVNKRKRLPKPWPIKLDAFADPRALIKKFLLKTAEADRFIRPDTHFMTFGSCFAQNLAKALAAQKYTVFSEIIGEEVNSTYANRYLLEWIENGPIDPQTQTMEITYGPEMRARFREGIRTSDVIVLTLGVAPCFFDETGDFVFLAARTNTGIQTLQSDYSMRTTSVAENVENIRAIIEILARLSERDFRLIVSVSPVPLAATTEFESAVIADCLSKSTLRLACHEAITTHTGGNVQYWPSFEIVRWLGPSFGPTHGPPFGGHDGSTRHVSRWLVDLIMELFIDEYRVTSPEPNAAAS